MITKISGLLVALQDNTLSLKIDAIEYEILIPEFTRRNLQQQLGQQISLHTIQYLEGNPAHGRMTPRLIGFISIILGVRMPGILAAQYVALFGSMAASLWQISRARAIEPGLLVSKIANAVSERIARATAS